MQTLVSEQARLSRECRKLFRLDISGGYALLGLPIVAFSRTERGEAVTTGAILTRFHSRVQPCGRQCAFNTDI